MAYRTVSLAAAALVAGMFVIASGGARAATNSQLQFADIGQVTTWRKGGDSVLFVQNQAGQWYRASLRETCMKLDPSKGISFLTEPGDNGGMRSYVEVNHHQCDVASLVPVPASTLPSVQ